MALPKDMRLKGHRTFNYIHKNSIKYHGKLMTFKGQDQILKSSYPISLKIPQINLGLQLLLARKFQKKL